MPIVKFIEIENILKNAIPKSNRKLEKVSYQGVT